jgi:Zn-dependent protease with chaperone function
MKPIAESMRCQREVELEARLLDEPVVRQAVEAAEKAGKSGARQQLLAKAVRISPAMSAQLEAIARRCREVLGVEADLEMYVYPDSMFNAACVRSERQRVFVMLSSGLLESFDDAELRFVVGHELGHHVYGHHRIPLDLLLGRDGSASGPLALQVFAWSRYAEVSADRAGLICAGDLDAVARALFKLASGLSAGRVEINAEELLSQLSDMREELARQGKDEALRRTDWFATHPFSPLRLRAAKLCAESCLLRPDGASREQLEAAVFETMALMEPSYLIEKTEEAEVLRRLLFAGGVLVAGATDGISDEETEVLESFFGDGAVSRRISLEALREDLIRRTARVRDEVPVVRRGQVIRDLCLVALADGRADEAELAVIKEIARLIDVDTALIEQTVASSTGLD